ncbi:MAG: DUF302 domain-containing protein [gamma proteobacterium symbiont of Bathyaustriella thionipta]|nr:DUF302 domain-containing protein [gamma proteobacterium symbiont of Bathyaustriella thionipta]MCU7950132.1 DUF302 domain-containing protein [gamma proteobacterium symbiont of Bathyaustriella thionipta]MCU7954864.1 DUF302 domain-containing protein [gamma proteobacterium symbiont of Bathyaustriella thionipta]MCU7956693.1 DUF302 domain-containing protein [gamma proteobacterium symbiont of Bathyaustriella thionipta]MCU7968088.1 DUF302 domain-containing protein [gamma proteobacterium symbiont of 
MKRLQTGLALLLLCITVIGYADDGLVVKPSNYSVTETLDRFETIIKKKGITVFTRINHAQGAKNAGLTLEPTELLIFGNPKIGNPLMVSQPKSGIDLPLKAIAWQDKEGKVWLAYNSPDYIAKRHSINDTPAAIKKMTGALNKFSDFATKAAQ